MSFSEKWFEILNEVSTFRRNSTANFIWYRGHSDPSFQLNAGLFRDKEEYLSSYLNIESKNYTFFLNQCSFMNINEVSWELLFLMQHYGLKTRLLDWTESFATALFFAFKDWNYDLKKPVHIWLIDPLKYNFIFTESLTLKTVSSFNKEFPQYCTAELHKLHSMCIFPARKHHRLIAQSANFILQGNQLTTIDKEIENRIKSQNLNVSIDSIIKKIEIPIDLYKDVYEYLTINSVNDYTLFPDLEGLSKSLNTLGNHNSNRTPILRQIALWDTRSLSQKEKVYKQEIFPKQ